MAAKPECTARSQESNFVQSQFYALGDPNISNNYKVSDEISTARSGWRRKRLSKSSLAYTGSILVLVGGILLLIFKGLAILGFLVSIPFRSTLQGTEFLGSDFIGLAIGIIAMACHRLVRRLEWGIIFIIIGIVAAGLGGVLILVGGILGIVSRTIKPT